MLPTRIGETRVVFSPYAGSYEGTLIKRTWKDRLFELPWRPWESTRIGMEFVPGIYSIDIPSIPSTFSLHGARMPKHKFVLAHTSFENDIQEALENYNEYK